MKLSELLRGIKVIKNNVLTDPEIEEIVFDSRKARTSVLFVALKGISSDGHDFVEAALELGAECCVTESDLGKNCIVVENTRYALAIMSANFYGNPAKSLKLIGVTGTNGKTTSTYLIKQVLEDLGYKVGLIGTINNMIGDRVIETNYTTPEPTELHKCFAEMKKENVDYVVMEVSSQALDQERVAGLEFETALFTNLTQDHLDYHKSMENYLAAKLKLFTMCETAVINADEDVASEFEAVVKGKKLLYSRDKTSADIFSRNAEFSAEGIKFTVFAQGEIAKCSVGIPGKFTLYNSLAVIAVCKAMGIPIDRISKSLSAVKGIKGRAELVPTGRNFAVVIDYAHTPDALMNIISSMKSSPYGRIVTLFGCGGDRDRTKRPLMGNVATEMSDFTIITSDNPRTEDPKQIIEDILDGVKTAKSRYTVIENRKEAIEYAVQNAKSGDIIILAGKGHETYQILKDGKVHFDEREIVADALAKLKTDKK